MKRTSPETSHGVATETMRVEDGRRMVNGMTGGWHPVNREKDRTSQSGSLPPDSPSRSQVSDHAGNGT